MRGIVHQTLVRGWGLTETDALCEAPAPHPTLSPEGRGLRLRYATTLTGTDFAAGTWLSSAWCDNGISGLHSG